VNGILHWLPLMVALLVAAGIDLLRRRIPNGLSVGIAVAAVPVAIALQGPGGAAFAVFGLLAGLGMLLPFHLLGGLAAGDVKLMAAAGAWLGPQLTIVAAATTLLAGGAIAILVGAVTLFRKGGGARRFAYAPAILVGTGSTCWIDATGRTSSLLALAH
jgi:Flp pilus assembly protein protease CpaA